MKLSEFMPVQSLLQLDMVVLRDYKKRHSFVENMKQMESKWQPEYHL
jgi:hypothetical protein